MGRRSPEGPPGSWLSPGPPHTSAGYRALTVPAAGSAQTGEFQALPVSGPPASQGLDTSRNRELVTSKASVILWGSSFLRMSQGLQPSFQSRVEAPEPQSSLQSPAPQVFPSVARFQPPATCPALCWVSPMLSPPLLVAFKTAPIIQMRSAPPSPDDPSLLLPLPVLLLLPAGVAGETNAQGIPSPALGPECIFLALCS